MNWPLLKKLLGDVDRTEILDTIKSIEVSNRYKEIVAKVGQKNIASFLPISDNSANQRDMINKGLSFFNNESTGERRKGGLLDNYIYFNNSVQLSENPIFEINTGTSDPVYRPRYATKIKRTDYLAAIVGKMAAKIKMVGTANDAKVRLRWYSDVAGLPGSPIRYQKAGYLLNTPYPAAKCSDLSSSYHFITFPFPRGIDLSNDRWLVLEYEDDTGIDENNHVKWESGAKTGYDRAFFDGSSWTSVANEAHNCQIFTEHLNLDGDFTIFAPVYLRGLNETILNIRALGIDSLLIRHVLETRKIHVDAILNDGANYKMQARFAIHDYQGWGLFALRFSKQKALDKIDIFHNGKQLIANIVPIGPITSGVGGTGNNRKGMIGKGNTSFLGGKVHFGSSFNYSGPSVNNSVKGLGPPLIVNKYLSEDDISEVSNLLAFNKITEEI